MSVVAIVVVAVLVLAPLALARLVSGARCAGRVDLVALALELLRAIEVRQCLVAAAEDNLVWGTFINLSTGAMCSPNAAADDHIVWGTSTDDFDNIVWGTTADDDNIVWGTAFDDDNIVWGTDLGDNIVWGTGPATASAF